MIYLSASSPGCSTQDLHCGCDMQAQYLRPVDLVALLDVGS